MRTRKKAPTTSVILRAAWLVKKKELVRSVEVDVAAPVPPLPLVGDEDDPPAADVLISGSDAITLGLIAVQSVAADPSAERKKEGETR